MAKRRRNLLILLIVAGLLAASAAAILTKPTTLGLDLKGGVELVYQGEPTAQSQVTPEALDRSIEIIRRRVDKLGVAEPEIQRTGSDQVTVSLPAIKDAQRAIRQVGSTAQLYFYDWETSVIPPPKPGEPTRPVPDQFEAVKKASRMTPTKADVAQATVSGPQYYLFNRKSHKLLAGPDTSKKDLFADFDGEQPKGSLLITVPKGLLVIAAEQTQALRKGQTSQYYIVHDRPGLTGTEVKSPKQEFDPTTNEPIVTFRFTSEGRKKFHAITRRLAQRGQAQAIPGADQQAFYQTFAVVLDRELVTRPFIDFNQNPDGIDGRTGAQISGGFTIQSAQDLADNLAIGALPINLKLISQTQVSATLGKQALRQGLVAGIVGLILVMIFLVALYRLLGVIADLALLIYAAFFYAIIVLIPITLTLPGIAGLVLTIGIAADANVVIFERVKEEVRAGRSVVAAIATGYSKGFKTIVDANVVVISTAFILFVLATAGVKGFAFVLGVGTLVSMFTAVVATQAMLGTMSNARFMRSPAMLGASHQRVRWHYDFMGKARWFFSMSGLILAISAVSWGVQGIKPGLDFQGGGRANASLEKAATENQVRAAVAPLGLSDAKVQRITGSKLGANVFQIQSKKLSDPQKVKDALDKQFGVTKNGFSSQTVGPTFGAQVKRSAIVAIIFSLLAIVIYISFRFEVKFAVPAIIALFHDILITFGVFSLLGREVTTSTVAALLTILGYSLYDTVIVFDRVRENAPRMPRATFSQIINRSMSEVMTRSLATSFCTLLPVGVLYLFGGETLKDFAFALIVGIISGAYSSIFIASPVLCAWKEREPTYERRRVRVRAEFGGMVPAFALPAGSPGTAGVGAAPADSLGQPALPVEALAEGEPEYAEETEPEPEVPGAPVAPEPASAGEAAGAAAPPPADSTGAPRYGTTTSTAGARPKPKKKEKKRSAARRARKRHGRR